MSKIKNMLKWCLRKAEKELKEGSKHMGLLIIKPDKEGAKEHITKAEHYLKATDYLEKGGFSDISASTVFYAMYHCLLAIGLKFGYESRNQKCTFALISSLIDDKKIDFERSTLDKIAVLDTKEEEQTTMAIREKYQYGTSLSLKEDIYKELFNLAQEVLSKTKLIIEQ